MEKTHLQKMIELWDGIARLHSEAMFQPSADGHHSIFTNNYREQSRMRNNAENVAYALRIYQSDLEG